jgi:hypothetical protein
MSEKFPSIMKLDAARRQIDFAIKHHFAEDDAFAIHTVISSAFLMLRELAEVRGGVRAHQAFKDIIRPGCEKEFWRVMNRASNFLKHADRDPDGKLEDVRVEINDAAIFVAIAYFMDLAGKISRPMSVFQIWYASLNPKLLTDEYRTELLKRAPQEQIDRLLSMPRALHIKAGQQLLKQFGTLGGIRLPHD